MRAVEVAGTMGILRKGVCKEGEAEIKVLVLRWRSRWLAVGEAVWTYHVVSADSIRACYDGSEVVQGGRIGWEAMVDALRLSCHCLRCHLDVRRPDSGQYC